MEWVVLMIWVPIYVFGLFLFFNWAMSVVGVIWAPFGSIICRVIATKSGLDSRRYTILGGVYSSFLFFPWLYLVLRMLEKRASRILIRLFYVLALLSCLTAVIMLVFLTPHLGFGIARIGLGLTYFAAWCACVVWLLLNDDRPVPNVPPAGIWGRTLPQRGYLVPLALSALSSWTVLLFLYISFLTTD